MGIIKSGILGGFNGKVGNVVGFAWRGISVMRSLAQNVHDPKSEKQLAQRAHLAATTVALKPFLSAIQSGYVNTGTAPAWAAAISYHFPLTVEQTLGANDWTLAFEDIALSNGDEPLNITISATEDGYVEGDWDATSEDLAIYADGELVVALYNETQGNGGVVHVDFNAGTLNANIAKAAGNEGDKLHLYFFAVSSSQVSATSYVAIN